MTNKAQTMLTIALTVAVSALLVDRIIEPAQAQDCAPSWMVQDVHSQVLSADIGVREVQTEVIALKRAVDDVHFEVTLANVKLDTLLMEGLE